jgi:hypothetical protein
VSGEQMRMVQIITGAAMALFIGIGVVPGLRPHAHTIRLALLLGYLLTCGVFIGWLLVPSL